MALKIPCGPRRLRQFVHHGNVFEHTRAVSKQRDSIRFSRFVQVQLNVNVAERGANGRQLMQQSSFVLPRLHCILLASDLVDHRNTHAGVADTVAQLRREVPLDLLSRERTNSFEQPRYSQLSSGLSKKRAFGFDRVARVAFSHDHLPGTIVCPGRGQRQFLSQRPKGKQADAKLTLKSGGAFHLEPSLHGVANMCGDIAKVRPAVGIAGNALAVIPDLQVVAAFAATANDRDIRCAGIDGILDQLGDGLQRIRLRQRDDRDRIPVVADAEFAPGAWNVSCDS